MNKNFSLAGALIVAVVLAVSGCGMGDLARSPTAGSDPSASSMASGMDMHGAGSMESMIHIQDGKFIDPKPLVAGTTVTVMNMDATAVTVTSDDSTSFMVSVSAGGTATFPAPKETGSYPFHSGTGSMHGVLTVQAGAPSAAATMVCADEAKQTVQKILSLPAIPKTMEKWDGSKYSCSYPLDGGDFVMSVTESVNDADAAALAAQLAGSLKASPIAGLANLGLPGYQSTDGNVVFAKDNMTLHVDATALPAKVGPDKVTAGKFAYEMATTILGCWTAHHR
ncbi:hypothetical protein [Arthrobacter alpinus]|uniref:hypothetical protein n=1 Tax=Arthrobacter alpinus TaxID=656366 RepID=UPI0016486357|nr:hypothetical protein [Arthrobacter alpinus]